jgi:hypothetical protein
MLRKISLAEGISYLLLLGIAMPLKYWAGLPLAVKIVGSIHGALFVVFLRSPASRTRGRPLAAHAGNVGLCGIPDSFRAVLA